MGSRYRKQEELRIELSGGDWLLVRKHLTAGEERDAQARVIKAGTVKPGEKPELDLEHLGIAQAVSYLLDWSITDADEKPIVIRDKPYAFVAAALRNQTPESLREILEAIQAHDAAMTDEREHEKKRPGWYERTVSDLHICRVMGWTYDDLLDLPVDVYAVLVETLNREAERSRK